MRWQNKDIPDQAILTYIGNNDRFRKKVQKLLGQLTGGKTKLTAEERSARASNAAKAGVEKRKANLQKK